jgi:hypothetical protein
MKNPLRIVIRLLNGAVKSEFHLTNDLFAKVNFLEGPHSKNKSKAGFFSLESKQLLG